MSLCRLIFVPERSVVRDSNLKADEHPGRRGVALIGGAHRSSYPNFSAPLRNGPKVVTALILEAIPERLCSISTAASADRLLKVGLVVTVTGFGVGLSRVAWLGACGVGLFCFGV